MKNLNNRLNNITLTYADAYNTARVTSQTRPPFVSQAVVTREGLLEMGCPFSPAELECMPDVPKCLKSDFASRKEKLTPSEIKYASLYCITKYVEKAKPVYLKALSWLAVRLPVSSIDSSTLDLSYCGLEDEHAYTIIRWLEEFPLEIRINLGNNRFSNEGVEMLGRALGENKKIDFLGLSYKFGDNHSGNDKALKIGQLLKSNLSRYITSLDLPGEKIDVEGVMGICAGVTFNQNLSRLNLYNNNIGAQGAQMIGMMLTLNKGIKFLNLGKNNIGDLGAEQIAEGLKRNETLKLLDLIENGIGEEGKKALNEARKLNTALNFLKLE